MLKLATPLLIACSILASSCVKEPYAVATKTGLHFSRYHYSVRYYRPPAFGFVSNTWLVDNLHRDSYGVWELNEGPRYYGWFRVDRDGNGTLEKERTHIYDLKLKHRRTAAVMWIQSHELGYKESDRALSVMLDRYVSALTGTGLFASSNVFAVSTVKAKSYAARVLQRESTRFLGRMALTAKISVVNLGRKKADPNYRGNMLRVTLVKIPFDYIHPKYQLRLQGKTVLLIGYYDAVRDYDTAEFDYKRLLGAIEIKRRRSSR